MQNEDEDKDKDKHNRKDQEGHRDPARRFPPPCDRAPSCGGRKLVAVSYRAAANRWAAVPARSTA